MTEVIVTDSGEPSADFAAGMAVVVAANAAEEAQDAEAVASVAVAEAAESAQEAQASAALAAASLAEISELRSELEALSDTVAEGFASVANAFAEAGDDQAAVDLDIAVVEAGGPAPTEEKPAEEERERRPRREPQTRQNAFAHSPFFRGR